jgi:hypothetical protein
MDALLTPSTSSLVIPKLCDDRTNLADYELHARRAVGSKGLVVHLEGHTTPPTPFIQVNGVPMVAQNIPVTDE